MMNFVVMGALRVFVLSRSGERCQPGNYDYIDRR
jgi:hypothetical protein